MERNTNTSDVAYFSKFAISNSSLKDWKVMPPHEWKATWIDKTKPRVFKPATKIGSYVDCLMFSPQDVNKRFALAEAEAPSDKVQLILSEVILHIDELNKNAAKINADNPTQPQLPMKEYTLDESLIKTLCVRFDHYAKTPDRGLSDVINKGENYFKFLISTKGKQLITPKELSLSLAIKDALLTDEVSAKFFNSKNCEVLFQQAIFANYDLDGYGYENVEFLPLKGMMDIIQFNHKKKQVREVDLKCTEDAHLFKDQIRRMDYGQQHSIYNYLIKNWLLTYKDGKYADYIVVNPLNIVIDKNLIPYIYAFSQDDMVIKQYGIPDTPIRGWHDDIMDIAWHFEHDKWKRPRAHYLTGFMNVNLFNKR